MVDTDRYHSFIDFRCLMTGADGLYTLQKGMPLVQVIPFRRAATELPADIRAEQPMEKRERDKVWANIGAGEGWYRRFARAARS